MITEDEKFVLQLAAACHLEMNDTSISYMKTVLGEVEFKAETAVDTERLIARYEAVLKLERAKALIAATIQSRT